MSLLRVIPWPFRGLRRKKADTAPRKSHSAGARTGEVPPDRNTERSADLPGTPEGARASARYAMILLAGLADGFIGPTETCPPRFRELVARITLIGSIVLKVRREE